MRAVTIICFSAALGWTILSFMSYRDWNLVFQSSLVAWLISLVLWIAVRLNSSRLRTAEKPGIPLPSRSTIAGVVAAASLSIFVFAILSGGWLQKRKESVRESPKPSSRAEKLKPPPEEQSKGKIAAPAEAKAQKTAGLWSVQVAAFRTEEEAVRLAATLKNKGYEAYVMRAEVNAVSFYRTKIGRFRTREEAERFLIVLKDKEAYPTAFVARM